MAKTLHIAKSGVWKEVRPWWIGSGGVWKEILTGHVGASGAWKQFYDAVPDNVVHIYKDAGDVPSGATRLSAYDQKFPMMTTTPGDIGVTGGAATHNGSAHGAFSGNSVSVSQVFDVEEYRFLVYGNTSPESTHRHSVTHTHGADAAGNLPEFEDFLAYTHPFFGSNALFFFDGAVPPGWSEYLTNDGTYPRFNSATGIGGDFTHSHAYSGNSGYQSSSVDNNSSWRDGYYFYTHTHPINHQHDLTLYPLFNELRMISKTDGAIHGMACLPIGTILLLTSSVIPFKFSLYSAGVDRLVRHVVNAHCAVGGSDYHDHDDLFTTLTYANLTGYEYGIVPSEIYSIPLSDHAYDHGHLTDVSHMPPWVKLYAIKKVA